MKNDHRKLLWVIFLEVNPNSEENLDSLSNQAVRKPLKKEDLGYDLYFPMRKVHVD